MAGDTSKREGFGASPGHGFVVVRGVSWSAYGGRAFAGEETTAVARGWAGSASEIVDNHGGDKSSEEILGGVNVFEGTLFTCVCVINPEKRQVGTGEPPALDPVCAFGSTVVRVLRCQSFGLLARRFPPV